MKDKVPVTTKRFRKQAPSLRSLIFILLSFVAISSCNDQNSQDKSDKKDSAATSAQPSTEAGAMPALDTVIAIVGSIAPIPSGQEIVLDQRQPFFKLLSSNKKFAAISAALKASLDKKSFIKLIIANKGLTIEDMMPLSSTEMAELGDIVKKYLRGPAPIAFKTGDVASVLNSFKAAVGCVQPMTRAAADSLYTLCAAQACPGGPDPCIPFQYVVDGCYARAHKMAAVIGGTRYCVAKIWSFANQGNDRLALRARIGGCCISWWYHVAVCLVVQEGGAQNVYVIDPGMFGGAVPYTQWLAAQADTACVRTAHVSSSSFTPIDRYQPSDRTGTTFNTDPAYVNTNATLRYYRNGVSCP